MRGFGVGLLLGFTIGVVFALAFLFEEGGTESSPPRPDAPSRGAGIDGADVPAVDSEGEALPPPSPRASPDANRPKETLLGELSAISHTSLRGLTPEQSAAAGRLAAALAKRPGLVPADMVTRLLAHENPDLRKAGILISWRVQPALIGELTHVMFEDPDHRIRYLALHMLAVCGERRSDVLDSLFRAAHQKSYLLRKGAVEALGHRARGGVVPVVDYLFKKTGSADALDRIVAMEALAPLAGKRPELVGIILAAARDENMHVRAVGIRHLGKAGKAGGAVALELLRSGDFRQDQLSGLTDAVVLSGRIGEALEEDLGPEITTSVIETLYELYDGESPELLAPLRGRFPEIYVRYRPNGNSGYAPLVVVAIAAGEHGFLRTLATGGDEPEAARLDVLSAYLDEKEFREQALAIAETILARGTERAVFRMRVVESLSPACFDGQPTLKKRAVDLMRRVAKSDPSPWVRAEAREYVPDEK